MKKSKKAIDAEALVVEEVSDDNKVEEVEVKEVKDAKVVEVETPQPLPKTGGKKTKSGEGADDLLMGLFRLFLGCFVWLPAFAVFLLSLMALGVALALVIMNLNYLGVLIIVCGCLMFALAFVIPLTKFVWGREKK